MRRALIAAGRIFAFLGIWAAVLCAAVMGLIAAYGVQFGQRPALLLVLEAGGVIGVLCALLIMSRFVDKTGWRAPGFRLNAAPFGLLVGAALGAAMLALPLCILCALGLARFEPATNFDAAPLGFALALVFVNVVHQEGLVRSYMFREIWDKYGAWTASLVTTAIFLLLHAKPLMQGVQGLVAGANILAASLMLSLALVRTRALWLPIGIHFGWNGLQGPVLGVNVTGAELGEGAWRAFTFTGEPLLTGGAMGLEGGLAGLAGPLAGLIAVHFLVKQRPA